MDVKERSLERFTRRGDAAALAWHRLVEQVVADGGGDAHLSAMYDRMTDVVRARHYPVVASIDGAVRDAYQAVLAVLATGPA